METSPHTIQFDTGSGEEREALFTVDTHPSRDIVATGDITGQINLYVHLIDSSRIFLAYFHALGIPMVLVKLVLCCSH